MSVKNFREYPDPWESASTNEGCCDSEAGGWCCTQLAGHDMPHRATGIGDERLYATWEDA